MVSQGHLKWTALSHFHISTEEKGPRVFNAWGYFCTLHCSTERLKDGRLLTSTKAWPKGVATVWNDFLVPVDLYKEACATQCLPKLVFIFSFVLSCKSLQVYTPLTILRRIRILNSFLFFLNTLLWQIYCKSLCAWGYYMPAHWLRLRIKWWWKQGPFPQEMNTQLETESKQIFNMLW